MKPDPTPSDLFLTQTKSKIFNTRDGKGKFVNSVKLFDRSLKDGKTNSSKA